MRKSIGFLLTLVLALASAIASIGPLRAAPVTYTEQATATGSLDGVPYTNASVVLTMTGNTTNVAAQTPTVFVNIGTVTVSVGGGTPETLSGTNNEAFVNQSLTFAGFAENGTVPLSTFNAVFSTYGLTTSIGPISGTPEISPGFSFATSSGDFILNSVPDDTATFTAVVSTAVPEPSSLTLLSIAVAGLGLLRQRRTQP